MDHVLTDIINLLTSGLVSYGQGVGSAINSTVSAMFIDATGSNPALSTAGSVIIIFAAVALGVGLTTLLFNWLTSLGNR